MVSTTSRLTDELQAQRPKIQAQIDANRAAQDQVNQEIAQRQRALTAQSDRQSDLQRKHSEAVAEAERKRRAAEEAARKARQAAASSDRTAARRAQSVAQQADRAADAAEQQARKAGEQASGASSGWGLQMPIATYLTSGFGWRPTPSGTFDYGGAGGYVHTGVDFGGGCGVPIKAAAAGEVWNADSAVWTAGNRVVVSHGVVNGRALATKYHHMTRSTVSPGQRVQRGQVIGYTGSTGNSTGCHLHFETILDGQAVDPLGLL
jgi:murein DD-endopeptidase MepM/ murein hydrolase activator NlpD